MARFFCPRTKFSVRNCIIFLGFFTLNCGIVVANLRYFSTQLCLDIQLLYQNLTRGSHKFFTCGPRATVWQSLCYMQYAKMSTINLVSQKLFLKWWWNWPQVQCCLLLMTSYLSLKGCKKIFFVSKQSRHLEIANSIFRKCKLDSFNIQVFGAYCLHKTSPWNFTILEAWKFNWKSF